MITYQDLIQEILNELLFQWSRREEAVQVGTQEFGYEIATTGISFLSVPPSISWAAWHTCLPVAK